MHTVTQPPGTDPDPLPSAAGRYDAETARMMLFAELLEQAAAERGLPPEPWAA